MNFYKAKIFFIFLFSLLIFFLQDSFAASTINKIKTISNEGYINFYLDKKSEYKIIKLGEREAIIAFKNADFGKELNEQIERSLVFRVVFLMKTTRGVTTVYVKSGPKMHKIKSSWLGNVLKVDFSIQRGETIEIGTAKEIIGEVKQSVCFDEYKIRRGIEVLERVHNNLNAIFYFDNQIKEDEKCIEEAKYLKAYALNEEARNKKSGYLDIAMLIQNLVREFPDSIFLPYAYIFLGEIQLAVGNEPEAQGYFKNILNKFPDFRAYSFALLQFGKSYYEDKDQDKLIIARKVFEEIIRNYPNATITDEARLFLAKTLYELNVYNKALYHIEILIKKDTNLVYRDTDILFLLGKLYYQNKQYENSMKYFLKFYNLSDENDPKNDEALTQIGNLYLLFNQEDKAKIFFSLVVKKYPNSYGFVESSLKMADHVKACPEKINIYKEILQKYPEDNSVQGQSVNKFLKIIKECKDYDLSLIFTDRLLGQNLVIWRKEALSLKLEIAIVEIEKQNYEKAKFILDDISRRFPDFESEKIEGLKFDIIKQICAGKKYLYILNLLKETQKREPDFKTDEIKRLKYEIEKKILNSYLSEKEYAKIFDFIKKEKKFLDEMQDEELYFILGKVHFSFLDYSQAYKFFKKIKDNNFAQLSLFLAESALGAHHNLEAVKYFNEFLKENPDYQGKDNIHAKIAEAFFNNKQYREAIFYYGLIKEPEFAILEKKLSCFLILKDDAGAIKVLKEIIEKEENFLMKQEKESSKYLIENYKKLGTIYFNQKKYKEAKELFIKAIKNSDDLEQKEELYFWLGKIFDEEKNVKDAMNAYEAIIKIKNVSSVWYQAALNKLESYKFSKKIRDNFENL